jgi:hypothetical protein
MNQPDIKDSQRSLGITSHSLIDITRDAVKMQNSEKCNLFEKRNKLLIFSVEDYFVGGASFNGK